MKQVVYKVPDGKMLRIMFDVKRNIITEIQITGDFFVHPEEGLELLETELTGATLSRKSIEKHVSDCVRKNILTLVGFSARDVADAILGGVGNV